MIIKKHIGLFFGTFNPIHVGHLAIANHIVEFSKVDEVWLVITPHSPFKNKKSLLKDYHRLEMAYMATEAYEKIIPSNVEFNLPQPNYTVNTLVVLEEKYPHYTFSLIMGEDNLAHLHKWKNSDFLIANYTFLVYPRIMRNSEMENSPFKNHPNVRFVDAPIMEISSTFIRKCIKEKKGVKPLVDERVLAYIDKMNFYTE